jgi:hypothetical protein
MRQKFVLAGLASAAMLLTGVGAAQAALTISGSSGNHSASAAFNIIGGDLFLTLTNTGTSATGTYAPGDVLTAVFFNITGSPTFMPISATIPSGSNVANPGSCNNASAATCSALTNVSTEWGYQHNPNSGNPIGPVPGSQEGVSSTGFNVFGPHDMIDQGSSPPDTPVPDGANFGIVGSGYVNGAGNGGVNSTPLIRDSVLVDLGATTLTSLNSSDITNVTFAYGTRPDSAFSGGTIICTPPGCGNQGSDVPEPDALSILAVGLAGLGFTVRRRKMRG